jgi:hypothetical protein
MGRTSGSRSRIPEGQPKDYDSSEFVEWAPVTKLEVKGEPFWVVRLKLRAKNAFGGQVLKNTFYFIRQNRVITAEGL